MNNAAYDISHLIELEATAPSPPDFRYAKPTAVKPKAPSLEDIEVALARELLQMDTHHEQMIAQYLRMKDDSAPDTDW